MHFIDPRTNQSVDTDTINLRQLYRLIAYCARHHAAMNFTRVNDPDVVVRLVRTFRAKAFRENTAIWGAALALLNRLDPPNCRCGKKGTRIIGSITFCTHCGPPARAERAAQWRHRLAEDVSADIEQSKKEADTRLLNIKLRPLGKNKLAR